MGGVSGREEDKFNCYGIPVVKVRCLVCHLLKRNAWRGWSAPATCDFCATKIRHAVWRGGTAAADARVFVEGRWQFDDDKSIRCII